MIIKVDLPHCRPIYVATEASDLFGRTIIGFAFSDDMLHIKLSERLKRIDTCNDKSSQFDCENVCVAFEATCEDVREGYATAIWRPTFIRAAVAGEVNMNCESSVYVTLGVITMEEAKAYKEHNAKVEESAKRAMRRNLYMELKKEFEVQDIAPEPRIKLKPGMTKRAFYRGK